MEGGNGEQGMTQGEEGRKGERQCEKERELLKRGREGQQ